MDMDKMMKGAEMARRMAAQHQQQQMGPAPVFQVNEPINSRFFDIRMVCQIASGIAAGNPSYNVEDVAQLAWNVYQEVIRLRPTPTLSRVMDEEDRKLAEEEARKNGSD